MRRHYREIIAARAESSGPIVFKAGRFLLVIVLFAALLAAVAGYTRLAAAIDAWVFLPASSWALIFFASLRVSAGLIALALRVWPLSSLQMVAHHRELLERRVYRLLVWLAVGGWLVRYLSYLGLLDPALSLANSLLATKLEGGFIAISLGDVLQFVLTVWLAYLLSRFLRFVLQEDVYPRIDLAPGLSYAALACSITLFAVVGFVAALGALGVDFSKVSLGPAPSASASAFDYKVSSIILSLVYLAVRAADQGR